MAIERVAAPTTSLHDAARSLFNEWPEDVLMVISEGSDRLAQLASLFKAIGQSVDEHSEARRLADMGQHVASDMANFMDCQHETYASAMKDADAKAAA